MTFRKIALATAAVSLAASPAIAEASLERSNAPVEGEALEGKGGIIIALLAAAAIIAGIIIAADGSDDDAVSP